MQKAVFAAAAALAAVASGQQDVLIHPGEAGAFAAEYFPDGMVVACVTNGTHDSLCFYAASGGCLNWGMGGWTSGNRYAQGGISSLAADGDSSFFYAAFDDQEWRPDALWLAVYSRQGRLGFHVDICPWLDAHEFAGTVDHLGAGHWIYVCVVDTDPPVPEQTLWFLRDTLYGGEWFPPVDSFTLRVRDPYLATGAGRHVYFAGRAGAGGDSLIIWTNRNRLEPGNWHFDWIDTGGDEIETPVIAAAFSSDDSATTVWCAYSRNRDNSGNWDIEYVYSTDGGMSWSEPQVLAGLPQAVERYPDLKSWREPGAAEVSIAYINSYQSQNTIYWRRASAAEPTRWSEPVRMNSLNAATGRNVRPRLCYLAGVSPLTAGMVYSAADGSGVWWGSPYGGGIAQRPGAGVSGRLRVSPTAGRGPFRVSGCIGMKLAVRDRSGRLVRQLPVDAAGVSHWDGTDADGRRAAAGVYFIRSEGEPESAKVVVMR